MKVGKVFEISYAHRLMNHKGKCKNLHGHNAKVEVEIDSTLDLTTCMVVDFQDISDKVKSKVMDLLDHSTLLHKEDPFTEVIWNHCPDTKLVILHEHPTAEILSMLIYDMVRLNLDSLAWYRTTVRFWETEDSYAECNESLNIPILEKEKEEIIGSSSAFRDNIV